MKFNDKSVIIIGSGLGGLSCGAYLSKRGYKVTIFERLNKAGGYVNTFKRKDYTFENTTHIIGVDKYSFNLVGLNPDSLLNNLNTGIGYFLFEKENKISNNYFFDMGHTFIDTITEYFPDEKENIHELFKYINLFTKDINRLNNLLKFPFVNLVDLITGLFLLFGKANSFINKIGISSYKYLNKILTGKSSDLVEQIKDPMLSSLILMLPSCCFFTPPNKIPAMLTTFLINYLVEPSLWIKNGTSTLINALIDVIEKNGGEIVYHSNVTQILTENHKAIGIKLSSGEEYFAKKIITNLNCHEVYNEMIKEPIHYSESLKNRLNNYTPSNTAFQTYLGLPFTIDKYGYKGHTNLFFNSPNFSEIFNEQSEVENPNVFLLTNYSAMDSSYSPPGKSSIVISTPAKANDWMNLERHDYIQKKQRCQKMLIERVKKLTGIPLDESEIIFSSTPKSLKYYSGNIHGSIAGLKLDPGSNDRFDYKSEIKNLYHTGADTKSNGSFFGAFNSGIMAGKEISII